MARAQPTEKALGYLKQGDAPFGVIPGDGLAERVLIAEHPVVTMASLTMGMSVEIETQVYFENVEPDGLHGEAITGPGYAKFPP